MNTVTKGAISESKFISTFLSLGYVVSLPFGDGSRYDMIVDDGESLKKVQVKTGRVIGGCVKFNTCSVKKNGGRNFYTENDVDLFAVYVPETDKQYLIPFAQVRLSGFMVLRLVPAANNQAKGVVWAKDFEI